MSQNTNVTATLSASVLNERRTMIVEIKENLMQLTSVGSQTILVEKLRLILSLTRYLLEIVDNTTVQQVTVLLEKLVLNVTKIASDTTSATADDIRSLAAVRDEVLDKLSQIDELLLQLIKEQGYCTLHKIGRTGQYFNNNNDIDNEKDTLEQLAKLRSDLKTKKDVQDSFILEGDPASMLEQIVSDFFASTKTLEESYTPGQIPSKSELLLSLCGIGSAVIRLLDMVDSLFINKFPMRKQVFSFTEKLLELGMAYKPTIGKREREGEAIKQMRKELPALIKVTQVMHEQLAERVRDLTACRKRSLKRKQDIDRLSTFQTQLDLGDWQPSGEDPQKQETKSTKSISLRLICHVCCVTATQPNTNESIKKGACLRLEVSCDASVLELRKQLSEFTSIPLRYVVARFPGSEQHPADDAILGDFLTGGDMQDVFLFDSSSSQGLEAEEIRELRRLAVAQTRLESIDWVGEWAGKVAQATSDYITDEVGHLDFIEGELVRVIDQKADGWCKGECNGNIGVFHSAYIDILERETGDSVPTNFKNVGFREERFNKYNHPWFTKNETIVETSKSKSKQSNSSREIITSDVSSTDAPNKKPSVISISLENESESDVNRQISVSSTPGVFSNNIFSILKIDEALDDDSKDTMDSVTDPEMLIRELALFTGIDPNTIGFMPENPDNNNNSNNSNNNNNNNNTNNTNNINNNTNNINNNINNIIIINNNNNNNNSDTNDNDNVDDEDSTNITKSDSSQKKVSRMVENTNCEPFTILDSEKSPESINSKSRSGSTKNLTPTKKKKHEYEEVVITDLNSKVVSNSKQSTLSDNCDSINDTSNVTSNDTGYLLLSNDTGVSKLTNYIQIDSSDNIEDSIIAQVDQSNENNNNNNIDGNLYEKIDHIDFETSTPQVQNSSSQSGNEIIVESKLESQPVTSKKKERPPKPPRRFFLKKKSHNIEKSDGKTSAINPQQTSEMAESLESFQFSNQGIQNNSSSNNSNPNYSASRLPLPNLPSNSIEVPEDFQPVNIDENIPVLVSKYASIGDTENQIGVYSTLEHMNDDDSEDDGFALYSKVNFLQKSLSTPNKNIDANNMNNTEASDSQFQNTTPPPQIPPTIPKLILSANDLEEIALESLTNAPQVMEEEKIVIPWSVVMRRRGSDSDTNLINPANSRKSHYETLDEILLEESNNSDTNDHFEQRGRSKSVPTQSKLNVAHVHSNSNQNNINPDYFSKVNPTTTPGVSDARLSYNETNNKVCSYSSEEQKEKETNQSNWKGIPMDPCYETLDVLMSPENESIPNLQLKPVSNEQFDLQKAYLNALVLCVQYLLDHREVNLTTFTKDNTSSAKKYVKLIESSGTFAIDKKINPSISANIFRLLMRKDKYPPIFQHTLATDILIYVKKDDVSRVSQWFQLLDQPHKHLVTCLIKLLHTIYHNTAEKKRSEYLSFFIPILFEDYSKKNFETCKHILLYILQNLSKIFN